MENLKKTISVILCVILAVSAFCFAAAADKEITNPQIGFSEVTGNPGNEVLAGIHIYENTDITDYVFTLNFDESILKYEGFAKGVLSDYTLFDHADEGRLTFVSLNPNLGAKNGTVITFKFKIAKKADAGDYKLTLSKTSFADSEGNLKKVKVENGVIKVSKPCSGEHSFPSWNSTIAATCIDEGTDVRVCENCGCTELKARKAKGHKLEKQFTVDVEAKGKKPGILSRHCTECGAKTHIIVYTSNNNVGLSINSMLDELNEDSLENLIYFINGNVTYPDITEENVNAADYLKNTERAVNEDGSINAASAVDHVLRKVFGNDKNSGIIGALKRAALADEIPIKFIGKLIRFIFAW